MKQLLLATMMLFFLSSGFSPMRKTENYVANHQHVTAPLLSISGATTATWTNNTGAPLAVRITVRGGDGGFGYYQNFVGQTVQNNGGQGAIMSGIFTVQNGESLFAISGSKGGNATNAQNLGGGGGGSGVVNSGLGTILILAAGGNGGFLNRSGAGAFISAGDGSGGSATTDFQTSNLLGGGGGGINGTGANGLYGNGGGQVSLTGLSAGGSSVIANNGNGGSGMGGGGGAGGGGGGQTGGSIFASPYSAHSLAGGTCQNNIAGSSTNSPQDGYVKIEPASMVTYYRDADNDNFGDNNTTTTSFEGCLPEGYVTDNTDCNDGDRLINPNTVWYLDGDNDNYYTATGVTQCTSPGTGYKKSGLFGSGDCNDNNTGINPGGTEACNNVDDNCNGQIDEGVKTTFYRDADEDGFGNASLTTQACSPPPGYVGNNNDCNDSDPTVNPVAVEVCGNNKDDNCNGAQNEQGCYSCSNATSFATTNITGNSATFNWTSLPHPNYWQVQYKTTSPGSKWVDVTPDPAGNKRSVTIIGLAPNKNYLWHIKARCGNSWTNYSVSIAFTTAGGATTTNKANTNLEMESAISVESLRASVTPNPSNSNFRIALNSNDLKEPVKLLVIDMFGRVIETRTTYPGQSITLGEKYISGTYAVRIIQGKKIRQLKLIKIPD